MSVSHKSMSDDIDRETKEEAEHILDPLLAMRICECAPSSGCEQAAAEVEVIDAVAARIAEYKRALASTIEYAETLDMIAYGDLKRDKPHKVIADARRVLAGKGKSDG